MTDNNAIETDKKSMFSLHGDENTFYKFEEELHNKIGEFLGQRPFAEVDHFLTHIFDKKYSEVYMTKEGIGHLITYLTGCPRNLVKEIMALIQKPTAVQQYNIQKPAGAPINDTPTKNEQITSGDNVGDQPDANKAPMISAETSTSALNVSEVPKKPLGGDVSDVSGK